MKNPPVIPNTTVLQLEDPDTVSRTTGHLHHPKNDAHLIQKSRGSELLSCETLFFLRSTLNFPSVASSCLVTCVFLFPAVIIRLAVHQRIRTYWKIGVSLMAVTDPAGCSGQFGAIGTVIKSPDRIRPLLPQHCGSTE
eukprot:755944-Hanusia_phi.AAC.1